MGEQNGLAAGALNPGLPGRERDRDTERDTDRERQIERDRDRQRETEIKTQREKQRHTETKRETERERDTQRDTWRETHREKHRERRRERKRPHLTLLKAAHHLLERARRDWDLFKEGVPLPSDKKGNTLGTTSINTKATVWQRMCRRRMRRVGWCQGRLPPDAVTQCHHQDGQEAWHDHAANQHRVVRGRTIVCATGKPFSIFSTFSNCFNILRKTKERDRKRFL